MPDTDKRKQLPEEVLEVGRVDHYREQERKRCILFLFLFPI